MLKSYFLVTVNVTYLEMVFIAVIKLSKIRSYWVRVVPKPND